MKESACVLNVLMFLFHHHMEDSVSIDEGQKPEIADQLSDIGFDIDAIESAFDWISCLRASSESLKDMPITKGQSHRVYSDFELQLFNQNCREFISALETLGILNNKTREIVIDLAIALKNDGIDISLIKWVTLMTLFHNKECINELAKMELYVLNDDKATVH